jgi:urease beta subunit
MIPGEYFYGTSDIELNAGTDLRSMVVTNTGDRPVQVGSHFHFFEVNRALTFEREAAFGMRLNIPSGTAIRFEPGQTQHVELVRLGGIGVVSGFNGLVDGSINDSSVKEAALKKVTKFCDSNNA